MVPLARTEHLDHQVGMEHLVKMASLEHEVRPEQQDFPDLLVLQDLLDLQENLEHLVHLVPLAQSVYLHVPLMVDLEHPERMVHPVLMERLEPPDRKALPEHLEKMVLPVLMEHLAKTV